MMSRLWASNIVWPLWFVASFGAFGVLELLGIRSEDAHGRGVPWSSLSQWWWNIQAQHPWAAWLMFAGLLLACGLLILHLVGHEGWPGSIVASAVRRLRNPG